MDKITYVSRKVLDRYMAKWARQEDRLWKQYQEVVELVAQLNDRLFLLETLSIQAMSKPTPKSDRGQDA